MTNSNPPTCDFCCELAAYQLGIAIGMSGFDANFCKYCFENKTMKEIYNKVASWR